ncbi:hypothetical protein RvY_17666 [Ramazzottius varieornatus]|uniref:Uncharacterized protein n=1 Tax=Ramazzottius varieornatus TaxID=947166 RepID=A0A1D1W3N6_RAMVA|nr:hypothetical protein RvY_17666 [Ramazzottius varieornatus]
MPLVSSTDETKNEQIHPGKASVALRLKRVITKSTKVAVHRCDPQPKWNVIIARSLGKMCDHLLDQQ